METILSSCQDHALTVMVSIEVSIARALNKLEELGNNAAKHFLWKKKSMTHAMYTYAHLSAIARRGRCFSLDMPHASYW